MGVAGLGVHIGTSGWSYPHWEHALYPPGTAPGARLEFYTRRFATAELNASFYRWPRTATPTPCAPSSAADPSTVIKRPEPFVVDGSGLLITVEASGLGCTARSADRVSR